MDHVHYEGLASILQVAVSVFTVLISGATAWGVVKTTLAHMGNKIKDVEEKLKEAKRDLETTERELRAMCEQYRDKCHTRLCEQLDKLENVISDMKEDIDSKWSQLAIEVAVLVRSLKENGSLGK